MAEDKKLRHPTNGGYPRGEETRKRIIEAAIAVFGERGFVAATTREIATRAEVNPPALQYYFENKEGLYRACSEYIACSSSDRFQPILDRINQALDAGATAEEAVELFCDLLITITEHMVGSGDALGRHLFMAREQSGHGGPGSEANGLRKQRFSLEMNRCGTALLSRISGISADDPKLKIRTMMLFGQTLVFHIARPTTLAALGWTEFDAEKLLLVKELVRQQTRELLHGWVR